MFCAKDLKHELQNIEPAGTTTDKEKASTGAKELYVKECDEEIEEEEEEEVEQSEM